jgi:hypothetical protein
VTSTETEPGEQAWREFTEDVKAGGLRNIPPERLATLGNSALAHSLALYRSRLEGSSDPLSAFNAKIERVSP